MRNATMVEGAVPINKRKSESGSQNPDSDLGHPASDLAVLLPSGPWTDFLASKPELHEKFAALVAQFHAEVPVFKSEVAAWTHQTIHLAEHGRQIGIAVCELEEMFTGKKLTVDFWQQIEPLFVNARTGLKITKEQLMWFANIARKNLNPITELPDARAMMQPLLLASGEAEFQLTAERGSQVAHPPAVPLNMFVDYFDISRLEKLWGDLKADGTSFVNGRLNPDLIPTLRVEFEKPVRLFEEIKRELGF